MRIKNSKLIIDKDKIILNGKTLRGVSRINLTRNYDKRHFSRRSYMQMEIAVNLQQLTGKRYENALANKHTLSLDDEGVYLDGELVPGVRYINIDQDRAGDCPWAFVDRTVFVDIESPEKPEV